MNEELQNTLADALRASIDAMGSASTFVMAELPEVIQQVLLWNGLQSGLFFLLSIALIASCVWVLRRAWAEYQKDQQAWGEGIGLAFLSAVYLIFVGTAAGAFFSLDWLQILVAPKVYLIEYASELAK